MMIAGQGRKAIALLTAKGIFDLVRDDLVLVEEELARQSAGAFEPVAARRAVYDEGFARYQDLYARLRGFSAA